MLTLMVLFVLGLVKFSSMALPATPLRRDTKLCISGSDRSQPTPYPLCFTAVHGTCDGTAATHTVEIVAKSVSTQATCVPVETLARSPALNINWLSAMSPSLERKDSPPVSRMGWPNTGIRISQNIPKATAAPATWPGLSTRSVENQYGSCACEPGFLRSHKT